MFPSICDKFLIYTIDCWCNRSNEKNIDGNGQCALRETDVIGMHGYKYARTTSLSIVHCGWTITFHGPYRVLCVAIWHVHAPRTSTPDHTHIPLFLLRVSGKRSCHAKVHNNRGAAVISYPAVITNRKSFTEVVEFLSHDSHSREFFTYNFEHSDGPNKSFVTDIMRDIETNCYFLYKHPYVYIRTDKCFDYSIVIIFIYH